MAKGLGTRFTGAKKPVYVPVKNRDHRARTIAPESLAQPIMVDRTTECHVTPQAVAERMARYAGDMRGLRVLEPSAGTGNLVRAALAAGADPARLHMVEMHTRLADGLHGMGCGVACADFLEWASEWRGRWSFNVVLMNPPFSKVRAHVAAARAMLAPGGTMIALVPVTFGDGLTLETLPPDTFSTARVSTKIVRIDA